MLLICGTISVRAATQNRHVPGRLLVKTRSETSDLNLDAKLQAHGAHRERKLQHAGVHVISVAEDLADSLLASLRRDAEIEFAERDGIAQAAFVPNDTYVVSGTEWHLAKIRAPQAWDLSYGSTNTVIAILDSGVNAAHPELAGHILPGYNFVSGTANTSDDFGHGTAVAGTAIAAGNNNMGVAGVAFGCLVMPVKVINSSGFAAYSDVADGIHYAVDHGARIINMSIGGSSASATLQAAVDYAWSNNVVVVASAGNNATSDPQYPAACAHVIGVSATEPDDSLASFSSYGTHVSMAAPGDNIWTLTRDLSNPYGSWRGTSFSSPIVAGVAALVASVNPTLSNDQIVTVLEQSADDTGAAGVDPLFGNGRVNASAAVVAAAAMPGAQINTNPPPPPPVQPPPIISPRPPVTNASITVQINGLGHVTPNLTGRIVAIGQSITLRASPGQSQVFAGWDGLPTVTMLPTIAFVLESNMIVTANFVPSPYAPFRGGYAGLFANTNGITPADAGSFRVALSGSGTFSGQLVLAGARHGFHGQFNAFGDAFVTIRRRHATPLVLALHVDITTGSDQITGELTDGAWVSVLTGDRNVFNNRLNLAQQAGVRSFSLQQSDSGLIAGTGSSRISSSGATHVHGKLADGRSFSASSTLAENGDYPLYLSFNHGAEIIIGWLNFPAAQPSSSSGTVFWVNSGTNAFTKSLRVDGL